MGGVLGSAVVLDFAVAEAPVVVQMPPVASRCRTSAAAPHWVAQVVQAVEHRHEVVAVAQILLGGGDLEADTPVKSGLRRGGAMCSIDARW